MRYIGFLVPQCFNDNYTYISNLQNQLLTLRPIYRNNKKFPNYIDPHVLTIYNDLMRSKQLDQCEKQKYYIASGIP